MGLLETASKEVGGTVLGAVGLGGILNPSTSVPKGFSKDFEQGLLIVEYRDGKPLDADKIQLLGSFMPMVPFEFGGTQQIVKEYYPGNPEPVVQVLGPRESDVTIKGRLKSKKFKDDPTFKVNDKIAVCQEYQELIDAMRLRGNIVRITLGEWRRYGLIGESSFRMNRLSDIEYSITFSIIGFNYPTNCKLIDVPDDNLIAPNKSITFLAELVLGSARNFPLTMPRTVAEFLNEVINTVASAVALVTGFVDGILRDVENIEKAANRAIGLIRHARATVSRMARRVGTLQLNVSNLASGISLDGFKTAAQFNNAAHIKQMVSGFSSLAILLAQLQKKFEKIAKQVPIRRHLVKEGETLQKISILYYNNADNWKKIYDHNLLQSSVLTVGSVLEIPR